MESAEQSDVLANTVKIAVCCGTNAGVENSMKAILKKEPKTKIINIGKATEDPMIIPYTIDYEYMKRNRDFKLHDHSGTMRIQKEILSEYDVVCCTCSSAVSAILDDIQLALVVIDEAAQATEAETIMAIGKGAEALTQVGDEAQLQATVSDSAKENGLAVSLF